MKLALKVLAAGKAQGQQIQINLAQFLVGRDPQCQIRPASPMISKRHCAILKKDGKAYIRDFGSTNGTFVNDEEVKGERELQNGDVLKIGPLLFEVVLEKPAGVDKPTPPPNKKPAASTALSDDEAVADLLLGGAAEDETATSSALGADDSIPEGTTEMELPKLPAEEEPAAAETKPAEKKEEKKDAKANTASAAAEILAKYARRQRGG